jgi:hypothetical protein
MRSTLVIFFLTVHLTSPAQSSQEWLKGNLHTHSLWSDGDDYPEMIMEWYKSHGYNFVALTDHNILAEGEKWIKVPQIPMHEQAFQKYLDKHGDKWVTYKKDSGRVEVRLKTYDEYRKLFEDKNFLIVKAEEITDRFERKPIHINATNIRTLIPPQHGTSVADVMQRNIDAVNKQRVETQTPMFAHLNHPNFGYGVSVDDMIALHGERFFEVFNGHPLVNNYGDSIHMSTEVMWDKINIAYAKRAQPLLYGLATDDSHNYHAKGVSYSNAGRGWVMVKTDRLTAPSIIEALESGSFYATTGVILDDVTFKNKTLSITIQHEPDVEYTIDFIGAKQGDSETRILQTKTGKKASFNVTSDYIFVRARITSSKPKENPFETGDVEMAWTQPVR